MLMNLALPEEQAKLINLTVSDLGIKLFFE